MEVNKIVIGNKAKRITSESWSWSLYVKCDKSARKDINEIFIHLHPTFKPNTYELDRDQDHQYVSNDFTGWGTFNVKVEIRWNHGKVDFYDHPLKFEEGGGESHIDLPEKMDVDISASSRIMKTFERTDIQDRLLKLTFKNTHLHHFGTEDYLMEFKLKPLKLLGNRI